METSFLKRLSDPRPLLLDGPTGTELTARGVATETALWSAGALETHPDVLRAIHCEYVDVGAEVVTANTFRTHARNLQSVGWEDRAGELARLAVAIAREAAGDRAWVAGSQSPLEDCYSPERGPAPVVMDREHALMAEHLADAGVDLVLVETHNSVVEVTAATRAASEVGLPVLVSVVCGADGRLLSGETLTTMLESVLGFTPAGVLVNCLPAEAVPMALDELRREAGEVPIGAYANAGSRTANGDWIATEFEKPAVYAAAAAAWLDLGANVIGGCCRTTPAHVLELRQLMDRSFRH